MWRCQTGLTELTFPAIVSFMKCFRHRHAAAAVVLVAASLSASCSAPAPDAGCRAAAACGFPVPSCRVDPGGHEQRDRSVRRRSVERGGGASLTTDA
jgi:hypothetical protein